MRRPDLAHVRVGRTLAFSAAAAGLFVGLWPLTVPHSSFDRSRLAGSASASAGLSGGAVPTPSPTPTPPLVRPTGNPAVAPPPAVPTPTPVAGLAALHLAGTHLGSSGPAVGVLQLLLLAGGFNPGGTDGIFGPSTLRAVRAAGLSTPLSVDAENLLVRRLARRLAEAPHNAGPSDSFGLPSLGAGSRGPAVLFLQSLLVAAGDSPGPLDGSFGSRTRRAVTAFQQQHHLVTDGAVGVQTWAALLSATVS